MNASIKTLVIAAALSGLLGGTPALVQAQSSRVNPFVQAAAEQNQRFNVASQAQSDATPSISIANLVNPFVQAAAEQRGTVETSSDESVTTMAGMDIPHVNPFVQAAAEQLHRDNVASETPMSQQAQLMH